MRRAVNIEDVDGLPIVGRSYWVPCVRAVGMLWPVLGPQHADPDLGTPEEHLHCDSRFISQRQIDYNLNQIFAGASKISELWLTKAVRAAGVETLDEAFSIMRDAPYAAALAVTLALPISHIRPPTRHLRVCKRDAPVCPPGWFLPMLEQQHATMHAPDCRTCPHRGTPLRGLPIDAEGGVVCPAHGLRWSRSTGELMPRLPPEHVNAASAARFREIMRANAGLPPIAERMDAP